MQFQLSGITTGNTRTITVPDADFTIAQNADLTSHTGATAVHGATGAVVGTTNIQTLTNKTLTSPAINTPTGIVKGDVGLGNVDNTSNVTERAATATLTNKTLTSPVINSPTGIVKADVGLGNVDNTSDATKNAATVSLTNKTLDNTNAVTVKAGNLTIQDDTDTTKQAKFIASLIPTSTTILLTLPNGTMKIVGDSSTDTLLNKTITKPTINGYVDAYTTDTDGATITFSMATSNYHEVQLGGNRTLAVSNVSVGQEFNIVLQQDVTGSRTVTWFTGITWAGGSPPTLTTTGLKKDRIRVMCVLADVYEAYVVWQNL